MSASNLSPGQIAVVDDTVANLHLLSNILEGAGYDVRSFPRGHLALKGIAYSLPDLILLDIQMPEMNGYEVCEELKTGEITQDIPVIFISALHETFDKVKAFQVGGVDYISKPFQAEEVLARVATHLQLYQMKKRLQGTNVTQAQQLAQQNHELLDLNKSLENANQELQKNYEQLRQAQLQLVQSEKMSALGNLVAGVAHEINNPVGCIVGNVNAAQNYINDLLGLIDLYQEKFPQPGTEIKDELETVELDYVREDLPKLIRAMKDGGDRITSISKSLRTFSRADTDTKQLFNLHDGIDSTVLILRHRLKANSQRPEIAVSIDYGSIPDIPCFPGQLNQVFMNILANAIDVFDDAAQRSSLTELEAHPQIITIQTKRIDNDVIEITIQDNGQGMSENVQSRIFDHLFTTKDVGKGTGLGLAIARQIVVEKHGGSLDVQSELGQGTSFCIRLPIHSES